MNKKMIIALSILVMLLPFNPHIYGAKATSTNVRSIEENPVVQDVGPGSKFVYEITQFDLGPEFEQLLQDINDNPDLPDIGYSGSLVGSEIWAYIALQRDLTLGQQNYTDGQYYNQTTLSIMQVFTALKLSSSFSAYTNLSQVSFPEDGEEKSKDYYYDRWPMCEFSESITSDEFWSGIENGFLDNFGNGFSDGANRYDEAWMNYPDPKNYGDFYSFAYAFGAFQGYNVGYRAGQEAFNENNADPWSTSWNDDHGAYGGFKLAFLEAREDGFAEGQNDYLNNNRIPDSTYTNPYAGATNIVTLGKAIGYDSAYDMYYGAGFLYQGAQEYFNKDLYWKLYRGFDRTYAAGYADGYAYAYNLGFSNGAYDKDHGSYGDSYDEPTLEDVNNKWDEGYNAGLHEGYPTGYDDGWTGGWASAPGAHIRYIDGMYQYLWSTHETGFQAGASDYVNSDPYDNSSYTLPFSSSTSDLFEQGANNIYSLMYPEAYDQGWKYAWLTDRNGDSTNWLVHSGPLYNISLPDLIVNLASGSVLPVLTDIEMFTELNITVMDGDYKYVNSTKADPMSRHFSPISIYAPDTNWALWDTKDQPFDPNGGSGPGIATTIEGNNMNIQFTWTEDDMDYNITVVYDMTTGKMLILAFSFNSTTKADLWGKVQIDYVSDTVMNVPTLNPTSWSYLIDSFSFNYDVPDEMPDDFVNQLKDFKTHGTASVGNTFLDVKLVNTEGLYNKYELHDHDPSNPSDSGEDSEAFIPAVWPSFQILPDWDLWTGGMTTANSIVSSSDWIEEAIGNLAAENPATLDVFDNTLNMEAGTHYESSSNVMYLYVAVSGALSFHAMELDDNFDWKDISTAVFASAVVWLAYDHTTGMLLGGGVKASLDFTGDVPDDGTADSQNLIMNLDISARANTTSSLTKLTDIITDFGTAPTPDTTAPTISNVTWTPDQPEVNKTVTITVQANDESGLSSVVLSYRYAGESDWTDAKMTDNGDGTFSVVITLTKSGDFEFYITATDHTFKGNQAVADNSGNNYHINVKEPQNTKNIGFGLTDFMLMAVGLISVASLTVLVRKRK